MSDQNHQVQVKASLFEDWPAVDERAAAAAVHTRTVGKRQGSPRVLEPNRTQIELRALDLGSLLPEDHRARLVWGYVERQDLSVLFDAIKARGAAPGRRAIDPRILLALWPPCSRAVRLLSVHVPWLPLRLSGC